MWLGLKNWSVDDGRAQVRCHRNAGIRARHIWVGADQPSKALTITRARYKR